MKVDLSSSYEEIINYIAEGISVRGIAQRVGMNEMATRHLINQLVKQHNITYLPNVEDFPFGMTDKSARLRITLGAKLYDLRDKLGGDRAKVGRLVGLNRREQIRAEQRPYNHDWTISQIERLAKAYSQSISELLSGSI